MKNVWILGIFVFILGACGDGGSVNVTGPTVSTGGSSSGYSSSSGQSVADSSQENAPIYRPTEVFFQPAPQSDILRMIAEEHLWDQARRNIDLIGFFDMQVYSQSGWSCGAFCGPNSLSTLITADAFRVITQEWQKKIFVSASAVKHWNCGNPANPANITKTAIRNIQSNGGIVNYINIDEPYMSGLAPTTSQEGLLPGCGYDVEKTTQEFVQYINIVKNEFPSVGVILLEPYPALSVRQIMDAVESLERYGVLLDGFHLDFDYEQASWVGGDYISDIRQLSDFFSERGTPFGMLIWGADGASNDSYTRDAWGSAIANFTAAGVTPHTIFMSWAESQAGASNASRYAPDNVPEDDPTTHTGFILKVLRYYQLLVP